MLEVYVWIGSRGNGIRIKAEQGSDPEQYLDLLSIIEKSTSITGFKPWD